MKTKVKIFRGEVNPYDRNDDHVEAIINNWLEAHEESIEIIDIKVAAMSENSTLFTILYRTT